ncbi:MAG: XTP/dITP diphosphatase [Magnetococcales bacterium]|nr:XTP/dITP diphosphatase [Magnetococcales bacterium]
MKILLATRNRKKLAELQRVTAGLDVQWLTLEQFPDCPEVEETGSTFLENARLKAEAVSLHAGVAALADDSGLVVDALDGAPGVRSARYAGPGATDADNCALLLNQLQPTPEGRRAARFVCVLALVEPGGEPHFFEGRVEGRIAFHPAGENGFGYDPLFLPEGHDRAFAEMTPSEKDSMSHRGRALRMLKEHLQTRAV